MSIGYLAVAVVGLVIGAFAYSRRPDDPITAEPGAPDVGEFDVSTADYGVVISDVLGVTKLTGNIFWYCCNRTRAIKKTQAIEGGKGGGSSKKKTTHVVGYEYYLTWATGICIGPIDTLYAVYKDDKLVWEGELDNPVSGGEETIVLSGMGSMTIYFGTDDQVANTVIGTHLGGSPNIPYRHTCWAFFNNCLISSKYNRVPTIKFVIRKTPTFSFNVNNIIGKYNYNPAHALWYILDQSGMCELDSDYLDTTYFSDMADTLSTDKRGISILFKRQQSALTYLESILKHIDGIIRYNNSGKLAPVLIRAGIAYDDVPKISEEDILDDVQLTRRSWLETINEVKVQYSKLIRGTDQASYFDQTTEKFYELVSGGGGSEITSGGIGFQTDALSFRDTANISANDRINSIDLTMPLFNTYDNINWITDRKLREGSYPLAQINFPVNRNHFKYEVGDVFILNYAPYDFEKIVFRVKQIREDGLESEDIEVSAIEAIDYVSAFSTVELIGGIGIALDQPVSPLTHIKILEAPWLFGPQTGVIVVPLVAREMDYELGYQLYFSTDDITYIGIGTGSSYGSYGTLVAEYPNTTADWDTTVGFEITFSNDDVDEIETVTTAQAQAGYNLAILGDEIICVRTITPVSGDKYAFSGIVRGKYDTTKTTHPIGTKFYFIGMDYDQFEYLEFISGNTVYFKLVPYSQTDTGDIADAVAQSLALTGRGTADSTIYGLQAPAYSQTGEDMAGTVNAEILEGSIETTFPGELGEAIAEADRMVVYLHSDGEYYKAKADGTKQPGVGIVTEVSGTSAKIKRIGPITKVSWAWTPGEILYLSPTTLGGLTTTRPDSYAQTVAYALDSDTIYFTGNISQAGIDGEFDSLKLSFANDYFGSTSVADVTASQADPNAMTGTVVVATDADTITTADADATYGTEEQNLINETKADYNLAATLMNETKADYNLLHADVSNIRSVLIGTIDYNDVLKAKVNALLVELRKTAGCGVLND